MRRRALRVLGFLTILGSGVLMRSGPSRAQTLPPLPPDIASKLPGLIPGVLPPATATGTKPMTPATVGTTPTAGPIGGSPVMSPQPGIAEWTVLVYAVADNDLEGPILDDLDEMERVGSVKGVNVVMEIDRWRPSPGSPAASRDDKTNGDWDTAKRYFVTRDDGSTNIGSKEISDLGEIDMSHPKELRAFLAWGIKAFPAKHYALVMEDHGSSWRGGFIDEKAPPELKPMMMSITELQSGLSAGLKDAGIAKLDVFATDACLMGSMEVAEAIAPFTNYWVASEELQPGPGYEYTMVLNPLATNPKMDGAAFAKSFVNAMKNNYGGTSKLADPSVTSAAFDMNKYAALRASVDKFATLLKADVAGNKIPLGMAAEVVDQFGPRADPMSGPRDGYADLVQIAAVVRDTTSSKDLKLASTAVIAAADAARVDKYNGDDRPSARGITLWLPPAEKVADGLKLYRNGPFGKTSPWSDVLAQYGEVFNKSVAPKVSNIKIAKTGGGSFGAERTVTAQIDGEVRKAILIVSQNFFANVVPVEIEAITDPALYKKLPEGPGVTAWKSGSNTVTAKWNPTYATLQGKSGIWFPLVVNHVRLDSTTFDADATLRVIGGTEEQVLLRFSMPKGGGFAGSRLLTGYFIDTAEGQTFYTPFSPAKLPAAKVALEPRYSVVDATGKASTLKIPLVQVKWDKIEDLKIDVRPMLPGTYTLTVLAEDFSGHVGAAKTTTTLP